MFSLLAIADAGTQTVKAAQNAGVLPSTPQSAVSVVDYWKQIAIIISLVVPSMRTRPDHPRWIVYAMRIAAVIVAMWTLGDYVATRLNWLHWPVASRRVFDYAFPIIYLLLYGYFVRATRQISQALADDRAWSRPDPLGRLIMASFDSCTINPDIGQGSLKLIFSNKTDTARTIWVSLKFELYRFDSTTGDSSQIESNMTISLPSVMVVTKLHEPLSLTISSMGDDTARVLRALRDRQQVNIRCDVNMATVINMTSKPTLTHTTIQNIGGTVLLIGKQNR